MDEEIGDCPPRPARENARVHGKRGTDFRGGEDRLQQQLRHRLRNLVRTPMRRPTPILERWSAAGVVPRYTSTM